MDRELAKLKRVVGLAEVMDFYGVMNGDERMMDIIEAAQESGLYLQGHAPGLGGRAAFRLSVRRSEYLP